MKEEQKEVSFVKKRALVTFHQPVCIPLNGVASYIGAAIVEYHEPEKRSTLEDNPRQFLIIELPDGKKLNKGYTLKLAYGGVSAIIELDESDFR